MGRRIAKAIAGGATFAYTYDGWNLLRERKTVGGTSVTKDFIWGLDLSQTLQGTGGVGGLLSVILPGETPLETFAVYDANGNVTEYVNASGATVAHYEYDPFGGISRLTGALADEFPHRFSTKYLYSETGLVYYGYRYYSPELGRWLSRDPVGEAGGPNVFGFVRNTPINTVDVLGLDGQKDCRGLGVTSFSFGDSRNFGIFLYDWSIRGAFDAKTCKSCCPGKGMIEDDEISLSIEGAVKLGGSTAGGGLSAGNIRGSWWAGIQIGVQGSGSVSGVLQSDRCNNQDLEGAVCLSLGGSGYVSGGGHAQVQAWRWVFDFGTDVTGRAGYTIKKCYVCRAGSCSWDKTQFCLNSSVVLNFNAIWFGGRWTIYEGSTCWDLE
jgi:RHS repeat-associated protein